MEQKDSIRSGEVAVANAANDVPESSRRRYARRGSATACGECASKKLASLGFLLLGAGVIAQMMRQRYGGEVPYTDDSAVLVPESHKG